MKYDVVIAGGGPVGLFLACELKLAGVSVLVLERLADPNLPIKAGAIGGRALNIPSMEAFYRRGLLAAVRDAAIWWTGAPQVMQNETVAPRDVTPQTCWSTNKLVKMPPTFAGHFAGLMLDGRLVNYDDPEFADRGPASCGGAISLQNLEALLADRAAHLQVEIRRGAALDNFETDADGVTVHCRDVSIRAAWLVGCDGGRSTVRKLAGFAFPGTDPEITGYSGMVEIADPEKLSPGWNRTGHGIYVNGPIPGRILTVEFDGPPADREAPITRDLLQTSLRRISGTDVTLTAILAASRWTDNARQASTYRLGRVLLAGDAAHVHSPFGGQGLNLGIGDAINLGWKLAATVKGWVPETLLDTYTKERHPIGAWALEWTRAQVALMRPRPHENALAVIVRDLIGTREGSTYFAKKISGVWQRYELPGYHPLIGRSAPDLEFADGTRLGEHLADGRALLIDITSDNRICELAGNWGEKVKTVRVPIKADSSLRGLFVRPDGCVAWAANGHACLDDLATVLAEWLGTN